MGVGSAARASGGGKCTRGRKVSCGFGITTRPPPYIPYARPFRLRAPTHTEYLADSKHQAAAFTVLAAMSAVLSVLCTVEPEAVLEAAIPGVRA